MDTYNGQPISVVQVKLDGWQVEVYRSLSPTVWFKSRRENVFAKLPAPIQAAILRLPAGTMLRGELHAPGLPATRVPTLLAAADGRLQLTVFDIPSLGGREFESPKRLAEAAGLSFVEIVANYRRPRPIDPDLWCQRAIERGVEGFVLKRYHGDEGYKLKPVKTVDAVVVGVTTAADAGAIKSLQVAVEGRVLAAVSSGLCGSLRNTDPAALIGRVVEVRYQAVTSSGRLQHARWVRWRDDKPAALCRLDQLQNTGGFYG